MMDGFKTHWQLTEGQGLWFTGTLAWIKRNKGIETGTARPIPLLDAGKMRIVEEGDLPLARAKQVSAAVPKRARVPAPKVRW